MSQSQNCYCGNQQPFTQCCQPILMGKAFAKTALELMRARYSAFCTQNVDFIMSSHHSKTVAQINKEEVKSWAQDSEWQGLDILQVTKGTESDTEGSVAIRVRYKEKTPEKPEDADKTVEHLEMSLFEKEKGQWKFFDAKALSIGTYKRAEPKTGRNDPCPCGSGKKFKKCCG